MRWPRKHTFFKQHTIRIENQFFNVWKCRNCLMTIMLEEWQLKRMPRSIAKCYALSIIKPTAVERMSLWERVTGSVNCLS